MLAVKPRSAVGLTRPPIDQESAISGARLALPLNSVAHWPAGHVEMKLVPPPAPEPMPLPYSAAVTPVRAHWAKDALAATPGAAAQGSEKLVVWVTVGGENASRMLAARMAWSYEPRSVKSGTGDHWPPTL